MGSIHVQYSTQRSFTLEQVLRHSGLLAKMIKRSSVDTDLISPSIKKEWRENELVTVIF